MDKKQEKAHILKGSAKRVTFSNGGEIVDISVQPAVLMKALEWMNKRRAELGLEESEWVRLRLKEKRQEDDYGNTHYLELNTWLPSGSDSEAQAKPAAKAVKQVAKKSEASDTPDLPF